MSTDHRPTLTLLTTSAEAIDRLRYTNVGRTGFAFEPDRFIVTLDLGTLPRSAVAELHAVLDLPDGWLSLPGPSQAVAQGGDHIQWTLYPRGEPPGYAEALRVRVLQAGRELATAEAVIPIEVWGQSQFDPARHGLPWANTVADLGQVRPDPGLFARTYRWSLWPAQFFAGLYRSIVFVGGEPGAYQGGLCTGMARAALERSLGGLADADDARLRAEAVVWHGRQLTDRAMLASAPWFLLPSPRRAFRRFRRDVLARSWSDVAFDVGVPRPWRRDLPSALMEQGHTVVPYAFRQDSPDRAEVLVYDPNHPAGPADGRAVITFDLVHGRYAYRNLARLDDPSTTVIAVRQNAYRRGRTALLASLASWVLFRGAVKAPALPCHPSPPSSS